MAWPLFMMPATEKPIQGNKMLNDEMKLPEGIEAQTYGRNNNVARDWLAQQMADWERTNKVTIIPIGQSKDSPVKELNFQESESNAAKRAKGTLASQQSGQGMVDFRGQRTQKQRKQMWKEEGLGTTN